MPKNIILCCDGTAAQFGVVNSNVVRTFSVSKKDDPSKQICYYDGGLGTIEESSISSKLVKEWRKIKGQAFGFGFQQNVSQAYAYLMEKYEPNDQVYLFGYSRGAFTVRVLAGMIKSCGLLDKGNEQLIPYAYELYSMPAKSSKRDNGAKKEKTEEEKEKEREERNQNKFALMNKFKKDFSRGECNFHFIGLWDTVGSVGWIDHFQTFPNTTKLHAKNVCQALSIDERRTFFTPQILDIKKEHKGITHLEEVWFAGSHGDIGGQRKEKDSGLSKIPLIWMLGEATDKGLIISEDRYIDTVEGRSPRYIKPNGNGNVTSSLIHVWWIPELLPKTRYTYDGEPLNSVIPLGRRRTIEKDWHVHHSVYDRLDYDAPNLPDAQHMVKVRSKKVKFH